MCVCTCMRACQFKCMCAHAYGSQEIAWGVIPQVLPPACFLDRASRLELNKKGGLPSKPPDPIVSASPELELQAPATAPNVLGIKLRSLRLQGKCFVK